jgi:hypothetical protein
MACNCSKYIVVPGGRRSKSFFARNILQDGVETSILAKKNTVFSASRSPEFGAVRYYLEMP